MIIDQAIIQPLLVRMDAYAPVINLAGRQRMLSQKLAKAALAAESAPDSQLREASRAELSVALAEWIAANDALRHGSDELRIPRIVSAELESEWAALDHDFQPIVDAAQQIIAGNDEPPRAAAILTHEAPFLARMEQIVGLFELEAAQEVARLRIYSLAIAAAVASLLVTLGWFVVRPATRAIRTQVDELEHRVAQRTADLAEMVASLQHEVAERKLAEANSRRLAAQLSHADRVASMGHLAIGLAHELNQPLGAIANFAAASEVILEQSPPADDRRLHQYLRQISEASLRAGQIVHRIRRFVARTKDDANDYEPVDLAALIREVVDLCQYEIRRHETTLDLRLGEHPVQVAADPIEIQQVLVNLVQNALQSMLAIPAASRCIAIELEVDDDWATVNVFDNGPGFDAADLEAPFAPFHTTKAAGLGVGLSICRTIIAAHGGDIRIRPATSGAHVAFQLPVTQPNVSLANEAEPFEIMDRITG
ncbi:ATP-binding protein [Lacipirellula sp.]|uniref:ATP-binding protein n=1 Tax=Lacipirellula sp. TaxID=2691419 RepID=UPI003D0F2857